MWHFSGRGFVISARFQKVAMTLYMSRNTTHLILSSFLFLLCPLPGDSVCHWRDRVLYLKYLGTAIGVLTPAPATLLTCMGLLQISSSHRGLPVRTLWATCGLEDSISHPDQKGLLQALGSWQAFASGRGYRVTGAETSGKVSAGKADPAVRAHWEACCPVPMEHE